MIDIKGQSLFLWSLTEKINNIIGDDYKISDINCKISFYMPMNILYTLYKDGIEFAFRVMAKTDKEDLFVVVFLSSNIDMTYKTDDFSDIADEVKRRCDYFFNTFRG